MVHAIIVCAVIDAVHAAHGLEQPMVLHGLVYVEIGTRRGVEARQQLVHDDEQLHLVGTVDEGVLYLGLEILNRLAVQHVHVRLVLEEVLGVLAVIDIHRVGAQISLVWLERGDDGAFLETSLLEYLVVLTSRVDGIRNKQRVAVTLGKARLHLEVEHDVCGNPAQPCS